MSGEKGFRKRYVLTVLSQFKKFPSLLQAGQVVFYGSTYGLVESYILLILKSVLEIYGMR